MNWRRGLFRLWIVGTALFVIAIAFVSYTEIKAQFDATANAAAWEEFRVVPQLCGEARGVAGTDYSTERGQQDYFGDKPQLFRHMLVCDIEVLTALS